ncbi:hypothetical protein [Dactylosporangium sp. CA-233914]|uniref:hypothetical protein n=1 Tax=Dactylosporangium sp. CA-233914 TaxID=3239934 RepID=UPI003D92C76A
MAVTSRHRIALGLALAAPAPFAIGLFASVNSGGYISLEKLAHPGLAFALSMGLLGAAGTLSLRRRWLRITTSSPPATRSSRHPPTTAW